MRAVAEQRVAELIANGQRVPPGLRAALGWRRGGNPRRADREKPPTTEEAVELPAHPLWRDLESKTLRELAHIRSTLLNGRRRQLNTQIAELVLIQVEIDGRATAGDREVRLQTPLGLTNPMVFQVGTMPEIRELEPNDPGVTTMLPPAPPLDLPVLLNGQIKPGDVDRFRFRARRGQQLVLEV